MEKPKASAPRRTPGRFVLLEHRTAEGTHWDFMLEVQGEPLLATWRLSANPLEPDGEVPAERIQDHRPLYLDYEGQVGGNRGSVRRLDRGDAEVVESTDGWTVDLRGVRLSGRFDIQRNADGTGRWVPR